MKLVTVPIGRWPQCQQFLEQNYHVYGQDYVYHRLGYSICLEFLSRERYIQFIRFLYPNSTVD